MKPLVLIDVDGPLNPWAAPTCPDGYAEHRFRRPKALARLNPAHGPALLGLAERTGADLAWATSWGHRANATIGPAIGLPPLPVVDLPDGPGWKFPAVARFAYGRPLAWLDDDFALGARTDFLARRRDVPTLLVDVDPAVGLTAGHLSGVEAWLGDASR